jgi:hypothetical protein
MINATQTSGKTTQRPYGWYMTNFGPWFEIDTSRTKTSSGAPWRRRGGLEFVRLFVSAGGVKSTESSQFLQLMAMLRTISPERYHHNRGIYFDLVGLTATTQKCYRGWLLDEGLQPMTDKGMAGRLSVSIEIMRQAVKDLQKSGLIQRSRLPEFDPSADEEERSGGEEPKSKARARAEKPRKTKRAKGICKDLQAFAKGAGPLIKREGEMANGKGEIEIQDELAKGKVKTEGESQGQQESQPTSPTTAPPEGQGPGPTRPQDVSDEGPRHQQPSAGGKPAYAPPAVSGGPRIIPLQRAGDARPIGDLLPRALDGLAHGQAVRADDFAAEILGLLRAPFDASSRDGVRELGNYRAAWLDAIDAGLSSADMDELRAKVRKDARTIGEHRKRRYARGGSPEQYWRFLFNKHLDARRKPPARAGPTAAVAG